MNSFERERVRAQLKSYNIPVLSGFPGGHGDVNLPLVMGANVTIDVRTDGATQGCRSERCFVWHFSHKGRRLVRIHIDGLDNRR